MGLYNFEKWMEKCSADEMNSIASVLYNAPETNYDAVKRQVSIDSTTGFLKNKLFITGIHEEIKDAKTEKSNDARTGGKTTARKIGTNQDQC